MQAAERQAFHSAAAGQAALGKQGFDHQPVFPGAVMQRRFASSGIAKRQSGPCFCKVCFSIRLAWGFS